jgi:hypothetical protein
VLSAPVPRPPTNSILCPRPGLHLPMGPGGPGGPGDPVGPWGQWLLISVKVLDSSWSPGEEKIVSEQDGHSSVVTTSACQL